jgi:hypothetical protein
VVGLVSLGVYLATLAPGLTWAHDSADGGELAAAAYTLGIAHPPGYPTYLLLAHVFTRLPVGEIATRTNLFSAVCAAGAAALLTWVLMRETHSPAASAGAGLALAFSPLLWSQATVTEVHALNGFFTALLLALASSARGPFLTLASGIVWGLSLGNHPTALFCGPLVVLALRRRSWALGAAGIGLGLAVYLYLPLRAAASPINWGDPQTLDRFWWVLSGAPYRGFLFSLPLRYLPARLLAWAGLLTRQFTAVGLVAVALGAGALWTTERPLLAATGTTVALCSLFAIGYNTTDSYLYLMPALVCLGFWLGVGVDWLTTTLAARVRWTAWVTGALAIALPLLALACRYPTLDLSSDRAARDFGDLVLEEAPTGAIILSRQDGHTFALWYSQYALGERRDVVVVDPALLGYDWYTADLPRWLAADLPVDRFQSGGEGELQLAAAALGRPVCWIPEDEAGLSCVE